MLDYKPNLTLLAEALYEVTEGWHLSDTEDDDVTANTGAIAGSQEHQNLVAAIRLARSIGVVPL